MNLLKIYFYVFFLIFTFSLNSFGEVKTERVIHFLQTEVNPRYRLHKDQLLFADRNIQRGLFLIQQLLRNEFPFIEATQSENEKVKDVLAILWGFFYLSYEKGQGFDEGTLVIEDPEFKFFQFLNDSRFSYTRLSSHLAHIKEVTSSSQYGIDILGKFDASFNDWIPFHYSRSLFSLFNKNKTPIALLPGNKTHILFSKMPGTLETVLPTNHIFIKMEDHGLSTVTAIREHAKDFLSAKYGIFFKDRVIGDAYHYRIERADLNIVALFQEIMTLTEKGSRILDSDLMKSHELGLRYMLSRIQSVRAAPHSADVAIHIQHFLDYVESRHLDHHDRRTGKEVIFSIDELRERFSAADLTD